MVAEAGPVFIGGLDRSGKTPVRRILEASTEISFSRGTYLWTRFDGRHGDLTDDGRLARCLDELRHYAPLRARHVNLDSVERELRHGRRSYARLFGLIGAHSARAAGKVRWGEQEGGVEGRIDAILTEFPDARLIHLVRDPRDRHLAVEAAGRRLGLLGVSVARWQDNARRALSNAGRHPGRYLVLRYEDLATAPRETALLVARFIGEVDSLQMADAAAAWAERAGVDYDAAAVGRFATDMPVSEQWFVQACLAHELDKLRYPILQLRVTFTDRLRYAAAVWPLNSLRRVGTASAFRRRDGSA